MTPIEQHILQLAERQGFFLVKIRPRDENLRQVCMHLANRGYLRAEGYVKEGGTHGYLFERTEKDYQIVNT